MKYPLKSAIIACALVMGITACGPSYNQTAEVDTIEAWEEYLSNIPKTHATWFKSSVRLEELRYEATQEDGSLAAYDAFLEIYKDDSDSQLSKKAHEDREGAMYRWADEVGTAEAWQQYLKEYPRVPRKKRVEAHRRIRMGENLHRVSLGSVRQERVNLAEDPEGPLNGWGWSVDVTNTGDKPIEKLVVAVYFLDEDDRVLDRRAWPAVATVLPGFLPFETGFDAPIKPGGTRTWEYTEGDMPESWSRKVRVAPVQIVLVGDGQDSED